MHPTPALNVKISSQAPRGWQASARSGLLARSQRRHLARAIDRREL